MKPWASKSGLIESKLVVFCYLTIESDTTSEVDWYKETQFKITWQKMVMGKNFSWKDRSKEGIKMTQEKCRVWVFYTEAQYMSMDW